VVVGEEKLQGQREDGKGSSGELRLSTKKAELDER
jgi:hypothetical protein